jgi:hypothetical protein
MSDDGIDFHVTSHVKMKPGLGISLFGWPWPKLTPLAVNKGVAFGTHAAVKNFHVEHFKEDD